jgi:hypothetical protein
MKFYSKPRVCSAANQEKKHPTLCFIDEDEELRSKFLKLVQKVTTVHPPWNWKSGLLTPHPQLLPLNAVLYREMYQRFGHNQPLIPESPCLKLRGHSVYTTPHSP